MQDFPAKTIQNESMHIWYPHTLTEPKETNCLAIYDPCTDKFKSLIKLKSSELYWLLWKHTKKKQLPSAILKWNEMFNLSLTDWTDIYKSPLKTVNSTVLQCFQYKLLHRTINCRHWLYNLKITDSPNCLKCNEDDTLVHFFVKCL